MSDSPCPTPGPCSVPPWSLEYYRRMFSGGKFLNGLMGLAFFGLILFAMFCDKDSGTPLPTFPEACSSAGGSTCPATECLGQEVGALTYRNTIAVSVKINPNPISTDICCDTPCGQKPACTVHGGCEKDSQCVGASVCLEGKCYETKVSSACGFTTLSNESTNETNISAQVITTCLKDDECGAFQTCKMENKSGICISTPCPPDFSCKSDLCAKPSANIECSNSIPTACNKYSCTTNNECLGNGSCIDGQCYTYAANSTCSIQGDGDSDSPIGRASEVFGDGFDAPCPDNDVCINNQCADLTFSTQCTSDLDPFAINPNLGDGTLSCPAQQTSFLCSSGTTCPLTATGDSQRMTTNAPAEVCCAVGCINRVQVTVDIKGYGQVSVERISTGFIVWYGTAPIVEYTNFVRAMVVGEQTYIHQADIPGYGLYEFGISGETATSFVVEEIGYVDPVFQGTS